MEKFDFDSLKYLAVQLPQEVELYRGSGDFDGEIACIERWLSRPLFNGQRQRLELEKLIAAGMRDGYTQTADDLARDLRDAGYPHADGSVIQKAIDSGNVDFILHGGERRFRASAVANLLNKNRDILDAAERIPPRAPEPDSLLDETREIMRRRGYRTFRFEVEEELRVIGEGSRPGERLRVWLPYPCECATQYDIRLIGSSHPVNISYGPVRTASIETKHRPDDVYSVRFSYVNRAPFVSPDPTHVAAEQPSMPCYTAEQYPHIRFSPTVRELARELAGEETNPLILAKRVYMWITSNIRYSYVRDYLYIPNITEFAILNRYGDCGVMALAFITLCRCLGIPAKWQSGSYVRPDDIGSHDWAMFYVAPYGWMYCDPSFGNSTDPDRREFYFCNLDPFRLVAADEFQQQLDPPKSFIRMDPYDNQDGEAEYADSNVFFRAFTHTRRVISSEELD